MVKKFTNPNRKRHHENSLLQKQVIRNFLNTYRVSTIRDFVVFDTTGFNITANYNEYIKVGFRNVQLYCCEIDKKMYKRMDNKIQKDNMKNAHLRGELFQSVLKSKDKVKHINFDCTLSLPNIIADGLLENIDKVLKSNCTTNAFTFQSLYDVASTKYKFKDCDYNHEDEIVTQLFIAIERVAKDNGYKAIKLFDAPRFKDKDKRTMQPLVIGFIRGNQKWINTNKHIIS